MQTVYHLAHLVNMYHHNNGRVSQVYCQDQGQSKARLDQNIHKRNLGEKDNTVPTLSNIYGGNRLCSVTVPM